MAISNFFVTAISCKLILSLPKMFFGRFLSLSLVVFKSVVLFSLCFNPFSYAIFSWLMQVLLELKDLLIRSCDLNFSDL